MACGSGCCGPPGHPGETATVKMEEDTASDAVKDTVKDTANDTVDDTVKDVVKVGDCCSAETSKTKADCCSLKSQPLQEDDKENGQICLDSCYYSNDMKGGKDDGEACFDACCSGNDGKDDRPDCCKGRLTPCCDESCLDRIALRECSDVDGDDGDGKPCSEHRHKTRSLYAARLATFGCICRALVALGQESCCMAGKSKGKGKERGKGRARQKDEGRSIESCCGDDSCFRPEVAKHAQAAPAARAARDASPRKKKPAGFHIGGDPEKAPDKEHVVLSISGMTCTGCETKLLRTLGTHAAVANLKTSLVMSRAEFDLVVAQSHTVGDVMKHVERTTEFKCENISNKGGYSTLDICVSTSSDKNPSAAAAQKDWPDGVLEAKVADSRTVSVTFDPKVIGARDLVNRGWADGHKLQLAPPRPDPALEAGSRHVRHIGYTTLASALLTIPVLVLAWAPLPDSGRRTTNYSSVSLALATIVQAVIAGPFYSKALKALLFSRIVEMDLLVVLSTTTAYVFSVVSFVYTMVGRPLSTGSFFETSTLLVTLIMLGRWVAALARQKAVESISIRNLQTVDAVLIGDDDETKEESIDARLLQYGDVFKVMPDCKVPTDGTVVRGVSEVNEAMITGESRPVLKVIKSALVAGSTNGSGVLHARVTRLPGENTISNIAAMVDEAKLSKPHIQALADRVASYFVPVIVGLTIVTFCVWMAVGVRVRQQPASDAVVQAITYAMTVLIVSCPCAIGLAVPMVVVIASGVAAERGIVFKSAEAIEVMHKVAHVVFDKTGTVTQGQLSVSREWFAKNGEGDKEETTGLLLGLLSGIKHPVSTSIVNHIVSQGTQEVLVQDKKALPGLGVEGVAPGKVADLQLQAGNSRWLGLGSHAAVESMLHDGLTTFCFVVDGSVAIVFGLSNSLRPEAAPTIAVLAQNNIAVHLVSGDDDGAVQTVARHLNIAPANVHSRCSPAEKRNYVQKLVKRGNATVFVGDGTNDAAAIAQATVGVHVNSSDVSESAQSAADVVLMRPDLRGLLVARAVSRKAVRRIVFNFCWSFVYNLFAVLLAAGVFEAVRGRSVRIPPEYAGLGELVSVLPVVIAATLLRWVQY